MFSLTHTQINVNNDNLPSIVEKGITVRNQLANDFYTEHFNHNYVVECHDCTRFYASRMYWNFRTLQEANTKAQNHLDQGNHLYAINAMDIFIQSQIRTDRSTTTSLTTATTRSDSDSSPPALQLNNDELGGSGATSPTIDEQTTPTSPFSKNQEGSPSFEFLFPNHTQQMAASTPWQAAMRLDVSAQERQAQQCDDEGYFFFDDSDGR